MKKHCINEVHKLKPELQKKGARFHTMPECRRSRSKTKNKSGSIRFGVRVLPDWSQGMEPAHEARSRSQDPGAASHRRREVCQPVGK